MTHTHTHHTKYTTDSQQQDETHSLVAKYGFTGEKRNNCNHFL